MCSNTFHIHFHFTSMSYLQNLEDVCPLLSFVGYLPISQSKFRICFICTKAPDSYQLALHQNPQDKCYQKLAMWTVFYLCNKPKTVCFVNQQMLPEAKSWISRSQGHWGGSWVEFSNYLFVTKPYPLSLNNAVSPLACLLPGSSITGQIVW